MSEPDDTLECRIVIVAPIGSDAANMRAVLEQAGLSSVVQPNLSSGLQAVGEGCGVLLLTEDGFVGSGRQLLIDGLTGQPPWSDLPVVMIVSGARNGHYSAELVRHLGPDMNLALVERPLRIPTLIAAVNTALRARRRQYQLRDMLAERQRLLDSLEQRVTERTENLRLMVEELEAFSYSVSHDLRGPLSIIGGYAQVLMEDYADTLTPGAQELLNRISKTALRMDRLTQDLLAYTRVSRAELVLQPVDLDMVLADVIEQYPTILRLKNCITIHRPLGVVLGHHPSLTQIFSNLIENSLKFVRKGEDPSVVISASTREGQVRITVSDHGVGVAPEQHARIFGIFERASRNPFPGTGIGLAIAKKAVERMGGAIGVDSALDEGSIFWVVLPAYEASNADGGEPEAGATG